MTTKPSPQARNLKILAALLTVGALVAIGATRSQKPRRGGVSRLLADGSGRRLPRRAFPDGERRAAARRGLVLARAPHAERDEDSLSRPPDSDDRHRRLSEGHAPKNAAWLARTDST